MIVSVLVEGLGSESNLDSFDLDPTFKVDELLGIFGAELNVEVSMIILYYEGKMVTDKNTTLAAMGVKENDLLLLKVAVERPAAHHVGEYVTPIEKVRQEILGNPTMKSRLALTCPELVEAADEGGARFRNAFMKLHSAHSPPGSRGASMDLMDSVAQKRIEELIQAQNIAENLETAMEHHPESFGSVSMLYVSLRVNLHEIKAFVDCGAQTTISTDILLKATYSSHPHHPLVTEKSAGRCGLMRLLDRRFSGVAKGVGTGKILGRVHAVQLQVGALFLPCSVTVIEGDGPEMLLGLDMLKRHQCCVDLKAGVLTVSDQHIPFLPESEIPKDF